MCAEKMVLVYFKNDGDEFVCQHCQFTTPNQNTMHYHLKKHLGQYPHKCKKCDKKFLHKRTLELHMESQHETPKQSYRCLHANCGFSSLTEGNCRIHWMRMHAKAEVTKILGTQPQTQEQTQPQCKKCNKSFKSMTSFYYHAFECIGFTQKNICELVEHRVVNSQLV
jgi:hypothetical protein